MRFATFVDPKAGREARFGIVRGDHVVDVVAAANALHRAVPATSVKMALTSGPQTIAATMTWLSCLTIAGGVFGGASRPNQPTDS